MPHTDGLLETGQIGRANRTESGADKTPHHRRRRGLSGLDVDSKYVYWAN